MPEDMIRQLRQMGIEEGDTVLVHSSMKAIGTKQTPEEVLALLQRALGPSGTLLLPGLTYLNVTPAQPVFDSRTTLPCIGLLPRTFMGMEDVVRSVHPTHSVFARGRLAVPLTADHEKDCTPLGPHSPFMKLPACGGKLLFIGEILNSCTFMHGVEEIAGCDYTLTKDRIRYVVNGRERFLYGHAFDGWISEYRKLTQFMDEGGLVLGSFGQAPCYVLDAAVLQQKAVEVLRSQPHFFVTRVSV